MTLSATPSRARGFTFDDDALPYSLSSPAKLLALSDDHALSHSRSATDLREAAQASAEHNGATAAVESTNGSTNGHPVTPQSKGKSRLGALRRQSTADWTVSSPQRRRQRAQDAIARHTASVFFSVHGVSTPGEPLYVSEVVDRTMNPDFRGFDLGSVSSAVLRETRLVLRVWAQRADAADWTFLLETTLDLRHLTYIGRSPENLPTSLPDNTVLVTLTDGMYMSTATSPDPLEEAMFAIPSRASMPADVESTASYDAIMKLSNLDACIQDALATQAKLASDIQSLVNERRQADADPDVASSAHDASSSAQRAVNMTKNQIARLKTHVASLRNDIAARRKAIQTGHAAHTRLRTTLSEHDAALSASRANHAQVSDAIAGQRRRVAADVSAIFPVEPLSRRDSANLRPRPNRPPSSRDSSPGAALHFTIRGLSLPNGAFASASSMHAPTCAAALGHAAHATSLLSAYLGVALPYPLAARGSASTASDPIAQLATPAAMRAFPLYLPARYTGPASAAAGTAAGDRAAYAVFLLNKDVERLALRAAGLRVADLAHTLPNLKYVLLVATAGRGEMPLRKAGGVRGLLRVGGNGSAEGSRRGSDESGESVVGRRAAGHVSVGSASSMGSSGEALRAAEALRRRLRGSAGS